MEAELLALLDWDLVVCDGDTFRAYDAELQALANRNAQTTDYLRIVVGDKLNDMAFRRGLSRIEMDFSNAKLSEEW
eukprot:scaffold249311_cov31-Tisochrysis_lutea.AAC.3